MQAVEELATEMKRDADRLAQFATEELVLAFAEAADDEEWWATVEDDARAFLTERGIDVPDEIQVRSATKLFQVLREGGEIPSSRPHCEKAIQLYIQYGGHAPLKLPWLVLCVKWSG